MNNEVISAFVDNEPFNADELGAALTDPGGRDLLLDLMALRSVMQEDGVDHRPVTVQVTGGRVAWWLVSAAAVVAAVAGGFALGVRQAPATDPVVVMSAPEPTRVLKLEQGVTWKEGRSAAGGE